MPPSCVLDLTPSRRGASRNHGRMQVPPFMTGQSATGGPPLQGLIAQDLESAHGGSWRFQWGSPDGQVLIRSLIEKYRCSVGEKTDRS